MLKVRYFRLRMPLSLSDFAISAGRRPRSSSFNRIDVIQSTPNSVIINCAVVRYITTTQLLDDGSTSKSQVPTTEQYSLRVFARRDQTFISLLNPGRGARVVEQLFAEITDNGEFFFEPLEITTNLIDRHVSRFSAAKLVSAKVRDFQVQEGAIGRLEVTSKSGLPKDIAPFLAGKFYRIDSLAYEITSNFTQGLVWYSSSGTVRASGPLVEQVFPLFEDEL